MSPRWGSTGRSSASRFLRAPEHARRGSLQHDGGAVRASDGEAGQPGGELGDRAEGAVVPDQPVAPALALLEGGRAGAGGAFHPDRASEQGAGGTGTGGGRGRSTGDAA